MLIMNRLSTETWREALSRQHANAVPRFDELVAQGVKPDVAAMRAAVAST
jgi:hypothetical protein